MEVVNINVESQHGLTVVTFRGGGGESVEVRIAADHAAMDDEDTIRRAREVLQQVAEVGLGEIDASDRSDQGGSKRSQQDVWNGDSYRGGFGHRRGE